MLKEKKRIATDRLKALGKPEITAKLHQYTHMNKSRDLSDM
jgi:hypothetical protein